MLCLPLLLLLRTKAGLCKAHKLSAQRPWPWHCDNSKTGGQTILTLTVVRFRRELWVFHTHSFTVCFGVLRATLEFFSSSFVWCWSWLIEVNEYNITRIKCEILARQQIVVTFWLPLDFCFVTLMLLLLLLLFCLFWFFLVVRRREKTTHRPRHESQKKSRKFLKKKWRKLTDHVADLVNTYLFYILLFVLFGLVWLLLCLLKCEFRFFNEANKPINGQYSHGFFG